MTNFSIMLPRLLPALLALLPLVSAFYPYIPASDDLAKTPAKAVLDPRYLRIGSLSVPLRRLATKRDYAFHVINGATPKDGQSVAVNQDGTDYSYFSPIKFGSGMQDYMLLLDSAASNTWVMSSDCSTDACRVHNTFGSEDSGTLKTTTATFSVAYGTGNVQGIQASDTAHLGSMSLPLTFGLAMNVSSEFSSFPMDGILGLARPDLIKDRTGAVNAPSIMDVLISQKIINSKMFGLDLWRASDGGSNDGVINFGKTDSSRYSGNLNYLPALTNTNGFWEVDLGDAGVDGKSAGLASRIAIIDSGTSYILLPPTDAAALHKLIPGSKSSPGGESFTVPCSSTAKIQLTFGSTTYEIPPADYVGSKSGSACLSNLIGRQTFGANQWLVGDVFLKNVYTVFDYDGERVGFGSKSAASSAASSYEGTPTPSPPVTPRSASKLSPIANTSPSPTQSITHLSTARHRSSTPATTLTSTLVKTTSAQTTPARPSYNSPSEAPHREPTSSSTSTSLTLSSLDTSSSSNATITTTAVTGATSAPASPSHSTSPSSVSHKTMSPRLLAGFLGVIGLLAYL